MCRNIRSSDWEGGLELLGNNTLVTCMRLVNGKILLD